MILSASAHRSWICALLLCPALAAPAATTTLLVPWDRSAGALADHPVHLHLEAVFDRLGARLHYHDTTQPMPDPESADGLVYWHEGGFGGPPEPLEAWFTAAAARHRRLLVIGRPAVPGSWLAGLGLGLGVRTHTSTRAICHDLRSDRFGHEPCLPPKPFPAWPLRSTDPAVAGWRTIGDQGYLAVAVAPWGGWITAAAVARRETPGPGRWDLDPAAFLTAVFALDQTPVLDPTTAFGLRAAYALITAEGFTQPTRSFPGTTTTAGRIVLDHLLEPGRHPISAGFTVADIDPARGGANDDLATARAIAELGHVQIACGGLAGILDWQRLSVRHRLLGYTPSAVGETAVAARELGLLLNQPVGLMCWPVASRPPPRALAQASANPGAQIGGRPSWQDPWSPGWSGLAPWALDYGETLQVYPGGPVLAADGWREDPGPGVLATFVNANRRRALPVALVFPWSAAQDQAGLATLRRCLDWAAEQNLCWVTARDWHQAVVDSRRARVETRAGGWKVSGHQAPVSLRLPKHAAPVCLATSRNLWGLARVDGRQVVCLGPKTAVVNLSSNAREALHLVSSTAPVRGWRVRDQRLALEVRGFQAGRLVLAGWPPAQRLGIRLAGRPAQTTTSDANGHLSVPLPAGPGYWQPLVVEPVQ